MPDGRDQLPPAATLRPDAGSRTRARKHVERYADAAERLRPLRDECLVALDGKVGAEGVIVLPDAVQDQPTSGTVVDVGPRCTSVEVGERVVFGKWNGRRVDDEVCRRNGFACGELYVMRPVYVRRSKDEQPFVHAGQDHVLGVIDDE